LTSGEDIEIDQAEEDLGLTGSALEDEEDEPAAGDLAALLATLDDMESEDDDLDAYILGTQGITMDSLDAMYGDEEDSNVDEDQPEMVETATLPPFPAENEVNYPQENAAYFSTKKYCLTDKVNLQTLMELAGVQPMAAQGDLPEPAIDFPELYSIYGSHKSSLLGEGGES
jgi:hypothetical protein